jgi:hypothetical protein
MPQEPVVVLHVALTNQAGFTIQLFLEMHRMTGGPDIGYLKWPEPGHHYHTGNNLYKKIYVQPDIRQDIRYPALPDTRSDIRYLIVRLAGYLVHH